MRRAGQQYTALVLFLAALLGGCGGKPAEERFIEGYHEAPGPSSRKIRELLGEDLEAALTAQGLSFPAGSEVKWSGVNGVSLTNTFENHARLQALLLENGIETTGLGVESVFHWQKVTGAGYSVFSESIMWHFPAGSAEPEIRNYCTSLVVWSQWLSGAMVSWPKGRWEIAPKFIETDCLVLAPGAVSYQGRAWILVAPFFLPGLYLAWVLRRIPVRLWRNWGPRKRKATPSPESAR